MKTMLLLNNPKKTGRYLSARHSKTINAPWYKFYRVNRNETSVTEVLINDLKTFTATLLQIKAACILNTVENPAFYFPADRFDFRGFLCRITAMEYAKAAALKYISKLIDEGEKSNDKLLEYRTAHYEDLNFNLTERNIQLLKLLR